MAKKKLTTSKKVVAKKSPPPPAQKPKKQQAGKLVTLADGTQVMERYHNDFMAKNVYDPEKPDIEEVGKAPKDTASKLKYPPPKKNPIFRAKWERFLVSLEGRENFKLAHLETLEVLCDQYVEYDHLSAYLRKNGTSFKVVTRQGESRKLHPEVMQLERVKMSIRSYTKELGLFPKKDHGGESGGEGEEWK